MYKFFGPTASVYLVVKLFIKFICCNYKHICKRSVKDLACTDTRAYNSHLLYPICGILLLT